MVSHGNVLHNLSSFPGVEQRPYSAVVSWLPFFHDLGLILGVLHPLYRGVPSILMPATFFVQRPLRWLQAITRYRASTTGGPNFAYDLCVRKTTAEERAALDLRSWNLALNGSEPVRSATLDRFAAAFGPCGFRRAAFYPSYGLADATSTVSGGPGLTEPVIHTVDRKALEHDRVVETTSGGAGALGLVGCGKTVKGQKIVIVNPERLTACRDREVGEIWVSGPSVAQGYWNRSEETAQAFRARLSDANEGPFLRTGDLGFLLDGELFITGRLKDLIIIKGGNHYPEDIELTVEQSHRALRTGCGAAFSIDVANEERLVIVQEVEPAAEKDLDEAIGNIRQELAAAHEIDVYAIVLINRGSLPKTSSGKIQRRACRAGFMAESLSVAAEWREGAEPDRMREDAGSPQPVKGWDKSQATAAIESWMISYFSERFGIEPQQIDIRQPFTRYGLASIEAVSLTRDLEVRLARTLPPTLAWDYPTIEALANHLAGCSPVSRPNFDAGMALQPKAEPIAIIGIGCRFPGAKGPRAFWRLLCEGVDAITEIPRSRWDINTLYSPDQAAPGKMVTRRGGFLEDLDRFDANFFGISPREAVHIDPRQRLTLELAWEALEDAGIPPDSLAGSETGVFIATLSGDYSEILFDDLSRVDAYSGPGTANSVIANRLSYFFDLRGPSLALDTACSGSLVAIHLACQSLRAGESSMALAGGG